MKVKYDRKINKEMKDECRKENRCSIREIKKWSNQKRRKIEARENEKKLKEKLRKVKKEQRVKTCFLIYLIIFCWVIIIMCE